MAQLSFASWRNSPEAPLQVVFWVHFLFSAWSHLGTWSGNRLIFQDILFLTTIMWSIHAKRDPNPIILALGINLLSILLDIIVLSVAFPDNNSTEEFSAVMAIFNLILRVLSSLLLFKNLEARDELDGIYGSSSGPAVAHIDGRTSRASNNNGSYYATSHYPEPSKQPPLPPIPPSYEQHQ